LAIVGRTQRARCLRWETVVATPMTASGRLRVRAPAATAPPVATVEHVTKHYDEPGSLARWLGLARPPVHAVDDVTFAVGAGEVMSLVGAGGRCTTSHGLYIG